jgi:hypothetical protein|tara:strand:+ start:288 stop:626 length:339 start_codon:yes stop_codon:yes gene_type:complete
MSDILKNAKKHFHHRNADLRKISVPEWECEIYYKPASNLSIQERLVELTQENKFAEASVMTLILRARDKDGKLLWKENDKSELMMEVDSQVVAKIAKEINDASITEEIMEKN